MEHLEDLQAYQMAMEIGRLIWGHVIRSDHFQKDTIGRQLIRSADSIALNISEGYGRFSYADKINFFYYSRGSAFETKTALQKAFERSILTSTEHQLLTEKIHMLIHAINRYILFLKRQKIK